MIPRRTFVAGALGIAGGLGRLRAAERQGAPPRYGRLSRPILIPLADLATPWRARAFVADATTLPSAANPNQPVRLSGFVVRTAPANAPESFHAVCVRCPHELCDVDFLADPRKLPPELVEEIGKPVADPVYLCPCHNSTFKADTGQRLAGPAPRGLYQFRITAVTDAAVEIAEVEEDLLLFT
jgi:Rieske Fe-S protein